MKPAKSLVVFLMVSLVLITGSTVTQAKELEDYTPKQRYLFASQGINAIYAWGFLGGKGEGVRIVDVEVAWNLNHRDLVPANPLLIGDPPDLARVCNSRAGINHGTAVLGILVSDHDDKLGTSGIVPKSAVRVISQVTAGGEDNLERAIQLATENLDAGDVLIIEAQLRGPRSPVCECGDRDLRCNFGLVPVEFDRNLFEAIKSATAKGIIVVEPAGNGSQNLDDPIYEGKFDRSIRDSGAIIVGAGRSREEPRRFSFSNYGSRVDLQGHGGNVATTGYGDLFPGRKKASNPAFANQLYTERFGGTSSATPIVAGAVAALQGIWKARGNPPLSPTCLRNILVATGTPQAFSERRNVGPRPNLKAAINEGLKNIATLCASVYVSSFTNGTITKIHPETGEKAVIAEGFDRPEGIAIDQNGILYIGGIFTGVKRFDTKTKTPLPDVGTNICGPEGPSLDDEGNVFFNTRRSPCDHSGIWKIAGGTSTTAERVVPPFSDFGEGTAFLKSGRFAGHLIAAGSIIEGEFTVAAKIVRSAPPNFGEATLFIDLTGHVPVGVAVNSKGDVVVASNDDGALLQYSSTGEFKGFVAINLDGPLFLVFDDADNLYVTEFEAGRVLKFTPDGEASVLARDIPGVTGITIERGPGTSPQIAQELSSLQ